MPINAKLYAISQGVPEDDILTEDQSIVTLGESHYREKDYGC